MVRSPTGDEASEVSADQTCSFTVGSIVTPSLERIAATHSAAQARSAWSSIRMRARSGLMG